MAESIYLTPHATKAQRYAELIPQIKAVIADEPNLIANLANVAAMLKEAFNFLWVGFYIREGEELVLGPFQGPLACTRIRLDKGVCGAAASRQETILVADVDQFPGHIACSSASRSEIVVPLISQANTQMVLDVDSDQLDEFDEVDKAQLEIIIGLIADQHFA